MRYSCYYQIHIGERQIIERLYAQGYTAGKIARTIFRSRSTIWREIQRNGYPDKDGNWLYSAKIAQYSYNARQYGMYRRKVFSYPVKKEEKIYYEYKHIIRILRTNKRLFSVNEVRSWYRKFNPSWWNFWHERSWRSYYNKGRLRIHSWEEMGRRIFKFGKSFRSNCSYPWKENLWRIKKRRLRIFRSRLYVSPLVEYYRRYRHRFRRKLFISAFEEPLKFQPYEKQKVKETKSTVQVHFPVLRSAFSEQKGRGVSEAVQFVGILKILTLFQQGSLRFLHKMDLKI